MVPKDQWTDAMYRLTTAPKRCLETIPLDQRQSMARAVGIVGAIAAFSVCALIAIVEPASAQWCSMAGLTWVTGQVGNLAQGVPVIAGLICWAFTATYGLGGKFVPAVLTFGLGIMFVALGAFMPGLVEYGLSGSDTTLQSMDLGCIWS